MLKNTSDRKELRQLLLWLLSTSSTLAGISLALVGIVRVRAHGANVETLADDAFIFSSLGFLLVCYLIFFALRRVQADQIERWTTVIDVLFLASLTLLVAGGFMVMYVLV